STCWSSRWSTRRWTGRSACASPTRRTGRSRTAVADGGVSGHLLGGKPLCSPTRVGVLTGLYPGRVGITAQACHLPEERLGAALLAQDRPDHKAPAPVSATRPRTAYATLARSGLVGGPAEWTRCSPAGP